MITNLKANVNPYIFFIGVFSNYVYLQDLRNWHIGRVRQILTICLFAGFMQSEAVGELVELHPATDFWCDTCIGPKINYSN